MTLLRRKLPSILGVAALVVTFMASGAVSAAAATNATCAGGVIAHGTYRSLTITGFCNLAAGNVTVQRNLVIESGGGLNAAFAGSDLRVGGNLRVRPSGILVLGCEPFAFPCFNDLNAKSGGTPGMQTNDSVGRNLISDGATMVLAHHSVFWGDVVQVGGGGGVNCKTLPFGPPAYTTYEDNTMHGDVTVSGLHTCWSGFFRNTVSGDVRWSKNVTWDGTPEPPGDPTLHGDEDGNEVATNTVHGDLSCFNNVPAVQYGDSQGSPNIVFGDIRGQCTATSVEADD